MASYRFCRPDDMPMIVRAVNECYAPHFPGTPELTVEALRVEIKELDLWCSNCMVALAGDLPVAVGTGTKRSTEVQTYRLGVRAGHQRQGHGGHILTSLSQKLAVLGPERLVAEVADREDLAAFFAATGYSEELTLEDWVRTAGPSREVPPELVSPVTYAEAVESGLLEVDADACLERSAKTLANRRDQLSGLAIAGAEALEAFVLYRVADEQAEAPTQIVAWGCADPERQTLLLGLLLDALSGASPAASPAASPGMAGTPGSADPEDSVGLDSARSESLILPCLAPREVDRNLLKTLGFEPEDRYHRWAATATPL